MTFVNIVIFSLNFVKKKCSDLFVNLQFSVANVPIEMSDGTLRDKIVNFSTSF